MRPLCIRYDTTLEALARLKPAFKEDGTVTAGNSSQIVTMRTAGGTGTGTLLQLP